MSKRKFFDGLLNGITYLFSSLGIVILALIFVFIFSTGGSTLSFNLLREDYYSTNYVVRYSSPYEGGNYVYSPSDNEYFSSKWGIALEDTVSIEGTDAISISYIDRESPLIDGLVNVSNSNYHHLEVGTYISTLLVNTEDGRVLSSSVRNGAERMCETLNQAQTITTMNLSRGGGGIKGSLISTLYLILFTLILLLPLGIAAAIYLSIYAKDNKITRALKTLIDMSSGVPSIIFGLVGLLIFVPMLNGIIGSDGHSLIAGALTMTIMLLPTVISTTKETIDVIPKKIINGSLALGASQTQTTFKIILPNAIPGILTSTLLAIGRIIGESAALIFVMGTQIQDNIILNQGSTTLATHIYNLMGLENPNTSLAAAIAIIILIAVLILNILVKLVGLYFKKKGLK